MSEKRVVTSHAVQERLAEKCGRFSDLFRDNRILEMVREFYAEDAALEGPQLPSQNGRQAIADVYALARSSYSSVTINLDPVRVYGNTAYGTFTNTNELVGFGEETHRGLMIWRHIDGDWYVQSDFFFAMEEPTTVPLAHR